MSQALRLGIDTGGTYTDAVLLDSAGEVIASDKSLTTHHDLSCGIRAVLEQLPADYLGRVQLVSVSTTLATNAVVEGRGTPACLLLAGYSPQQADRARLNHVVRGGNYVLLAGGHDAGGSEREPLDLYQAERTVLRCRDQVAAFGISGLFGVRNPAHEIALRELVHSLTDKPVTCGHELSSSLDAPRRALTVAFNASLIPFVDQLIRSIRRILRERHISAPLMMVKGDGSLISAELAQQRPVETVLSGPAASVVGATHLHGTGNAIIADMGGTTTDIAIITDGQPMISAEATIIGEWRPMVEAIRVFSMGLGGDSEARFQGGQGLGIGPRRVIPMSLLVHTWPETLESLQQQAAAAVTARSNRYAVQLFADDSQRQAFTPAESEAWTRLEKGPVELEELACQDRELARAVARLVRSGTAIYSGFTPTDAAHVLGLTDHWSTAAARLAATTWARQMRQVYGWGDFESHDPVGPSQAVHEKLIAIIMQTLIRACLATDPGQRDSRELERAARLFADWISGTSRIDSGIFSLNLDRERTLVAVGAAARFYYPAAAEKFDIHLALPEHGAVANAVGAVAGSIVQRTHITITQPHQGVYRVYGSAGPADHADLASALSQAECWASASAREKALQAGAVVIDTVISHQHQSVASEEQENPVFFECRVTATASGRPGGTTT